MSAAEGKDGVYLDPGSGKWRAKLFCPVDGEMKLAGEWETKVQAEDTYRKAFAKNFSSRSVPNPVPEIKMLAPQAKKPVTISQTVSTAAQNSQAQQAPSEPSLNLSTNQTNPAQPSKLPISAQLPKPAAASQTLQTPLQSISPTPTQAIRTTPVSSPEPSSMRPAATISSIKNTEAILINPPVTGSTPVDQRGAPSGDSQQDSIHSAQPLRIIPPPPTTSPPGILQPKPVSPKVCIPTTSPSSVLSNTVLDSTKGKIDANSTSKLTPNQNTPKHKGPNAQSVDVPKSVIPPSPASQPVTSGQLVDGAMTQQKYTNSTTTQPEKALDQRPKSSEASVQSIITLNQSSSQVNSTATSRGSHLATTSSMLPNTSQIYRIFPPSAAAHVARVTINQATSMVPSPDTRNTPVGDTPQAQQRCTCSASVCVNRIQPSERKRLWEHSARCTSKKCTENFCTELRECRDLTDDMYEAFAKLERDYHHKVVDISRRHRVYAEHFPPLSLSFRQTDEEYFGTEHITPDAVVMTGVYNPYKQTLEGHWKSVVDGNSDASLAHEQLFHTFFFECNKENVIDEEAQPCAKCKVSDDTAENQFIVCDLCDKPFHIMCVGLKTIPADAFYCSNCKSILKAYGARCMGGVHLPPTREWIGNFEFYDNRKKHKIISDNVYLKFDYSQRDKGKLAVISGKGKNEIGTFTVKGILKKDGNAFPFQFSKIYDKFPLNNDNISYA